MTLNTQVAQTAVDFQGLAELRRSANVDQNDQETLRQVAGQFESLFVNMMLKSMRQAKLADGIFDSTQSDMYRDMADQQLAMDISAKGGLGLQDVIMRQLGGQLQSKLNNEGKPLLFERSNILPKQPNNLAMAATQIASDKIHTSKHNSSISRDDNSASFNFASPEKFIETLWPLAKKAADKLGVSPEVILSQAALETGWGKHVIKRKNGQSTHNLFNIKADSRWQGDSAQVGTLEYRNGVAVREPAQFRAYDSYEQSFEDYVTFLQTQPRYQNALKHRHNPEKFVEELHRSGYATDPDYANKIKQIMNSDTLAQKSQRQGYS